MGSTRKSFTPEYKAEAVKFVIDGGRTIAEVARNIGCHEVTLGNWVKKARKEKEELADSQGPLDESERMELIRLRAESKEKDTALAHARMQVEFAKKSSSLVRERKSVIFAAIADWAQFNEFPVDFMCRELGVTRQGYYRWLKAVPSAREMDDASPIILMCVLYARARGNPGVRRMRAGLAVAGRNVSPKRVHRLMRAAGLRGRHPRAWKRTTIHGEKPVNAPDLLKRNFTTKKPNQKWCGDITYMKTWEGWVYVATVIDLYSRAVVGYAVADHMRTSLVTEALDMVITRRKPTRPVIFYSDRGTQYASQDFDEYCRKSRIRRSLGRTRICYDNAVSESTFATYTKELIHTRPWPDLNSVKMMTIDWIDNYFNPIRRHSTLGYLTPAEYELGFREIAQLAASIQCQPKR